MRRIDIIKKRRSVAVDYYGVSYAELRKIASEKGLFRVGMKKSDLLAVLHDNSQ